MIKRRHYNYYMLKTPASYEKLLAQLCALQDDSFSFGTKAKNSRELRNNWEMGRLIVSVQQNSKTRMTFGENIIRRLSLDMTERFGKGCSQRTLAYLRDFALTYPKGQFDPNLSWSHYRSLLEVDDADERSALEKRAVAEGLSNSALQKLVSITEVDDTLLDEKLRPRTGQTGIYKVIDVNDDGTLLLDCGFRCEVSVMAPTANTPSAGSYVSDDDALTPTECEAGQRYCYDAKVIDVIDGDTVRVRLNLGFGVTHREKLRLRYVNAAELATAEGEAAKTFVERRLRKDDPVRVLTYREDKHGRWVADLFYGKGVGQFLNRKMLEAGVASFSK